MLKYKLYIKKLSIFFLKKNIKNINILSRQLNSIGIKIEDIKLIDIVLKNMQDS